MKILKFLGSLLPSFERSRVSEDVASLREEVVENIIPSAHAAAALTRGKKIQSSFGQNWSALFWAVLKEGPRLKDRNFFDGVEWLFHSIPDKLDVINKLVDEMFAKDVTRDTMTYRKASVIRYLEIVRFCAEYASRGMLRLLAAEANIAEGKPEAVDAQLTPAELAWFNNNQAAFFDSLRILQISPSDLQQTIDSIPDVTVVPEKASMIRETVGENNLDPMRLGLLNARHNPIYHIRMMTAEHQVRKYKAKKEEKRLLELRILRLKEAYQSKQDPRLSQQIEYNEGRLQRLNYELDQEAQQFA